VQVQGQEEYEQVHQAYWLLEQQEQDIQQVDQQVLYHTHHHHLPLDRALLEVTQTGEENEKERVD
jgi:hypothetical protein